MNFFLKWHSVICAVFFFFLNNTCLSFSEYYSFFVLMQFSFLFTCCNFGEVPYFMGLSCDWCPIFVHHSDSQITQCNPECLAVLVDMLYSWREFAQHALLHVPLA